MTGAQCIGAEISEKEMHLKCCIKYRKIENTFVMLSILNEIVCALKGINQAVWEKNRLLRRTSFL